MSFDVGRLRRCDWITGGGAVAFFVFLFFFDWYGASYKGTVPLGGSFAASLNATGWHTFTDSRWIWLITIVVAIVAVVLVAGQRKLDIPVPLSSIVAGLGGLSTLLILYRIVHHPAGGASFGGGSFSYGIKIGIWLGLIAAGAIVYGGFLMMREEGTSLLDVGSQSMHGLGGETPSKTPDGSTTEVSPLPPAGPSSSGQPGL
jgi:hypothetical protein